MHLSTLTAAAVALPFAWTVAARQLAASLSVNLTQTYQTIDGFGFSEAFQRAYNIYNLAEPKRSQLIDLLFNATTGAGFTILRNGIGSSANSSYDWMNTIEPTSPGSPNAAPSYVFDGKDAGQLWVSQQAVSLATSGGAENPLWSRRSSFLPVIPRRPLFCGQES